MADQPLAQDLRQPEHLGLQLPSFRPFLDAIEPRHRRLFVTVSGAHLYGFPSADSDYDLRGCFVIPTMRMLGIHGYRETIEHMDDGPNPNDVVLHEARKYVGLLQKNNGYVLEQVMSRLIIETTPWHEELKAIAPRCVNVLSLNHYIGFSNQQIALMRRRPDKQVKILLYIFRVLMTGIHLARTGKVEPNIVILNETFRLPFIDELVAQKVGREHSALAGGRPLKYFQRQYEAMLRQLEECRGRTKLPVAPPEAIVGELDDWLVRLRLDEFERSRSPREFAGS